MKKYIAMLIIGLSIVLASCSSSTGNTAKQTSTTPVTVVNAQALLSKLESNPANSTPLTETGSTLLYPLFNIWAPVIQQKFSNISISTASTGSGTGISQAAAEAVNIGASDAYLSAHYIQQYPGLLNIPLAISAQMINYNLPGISGHLKLSGMVLSEIYQGKITNWNDPAIAKLNPGVKLPNTGIVPLVRTDGSGDTFIFTTYLSDADPSGWGTQVGYGTTVSFPHVTAENGEEGNGGMVSGCAKYVGCIAYIGISYQKQTTAANLGEAELENASGNFELPTESTITAEAAALVSKTPANEAQSLVYGPAPEGYPIINYEYAIVNKNQPSSADAEAVKAVLAWCMDPSGGNQSQYLSQVGFQPLPPSVLKLSVAQLDSIS
jgi:phosphate transport system substrate-binding protein